MYQKGKVVYFQGEIEDAIQLYDKALEINSKCLPALCSKGTLLFEQNRFAESIEYLSRAKLIYPNSITTTN